MTHKTNYQHFDINIFFPHKSLNVFELKFMIDLLPPKHGHQTDTTKNKKQQYQTQALIDIR